MKKAILLFIFQLCSLAMFAQINTDRVLTIGRNALYFEDYVLSIQYFNQDISGIQTAIQTYALGYGYSADEAVWLKTITLDYNENSVETAFYLNCTDYPKVQITYYKDTHEFTSNAY